MNHQFLVMEVIKLIRVPKKRSHRGAMRQLVHDSQLHSEASTQEHMLQLHSHSQNIKEAVMEVIGHAELIVEWFLWTIEHTNSSLDNSKDHCMPDEARDGRNVALNYQVICRCADCPKEPFYTSVS